MMCCLIVVVSCSRPLDEILSYYETLNKNDIMHRKIHRRSIDLQDRTLDFVSHGQRFHMKLYPSREIFDPSFRVLTVDSNGSEQKVDMEMKMYRGRESRTVNILGNIPLLDKSIFGVKYPGLTFLSGQLFNSRKMFGHLTPPPT